MGRRYPGGVWRYVTGGLAFAATGGFLATVNEPRYLAPVLLLFGALLPLAAFDAGATVVVRIVGERRERRLTPPRPRATYLFLALSWLVIGVVFGLLTSSASTWLIWATVISGSAAVMLIGRALPSGTSWRPGRLAAVSLARRAAGPGIAE
jgi:peptidoglycan/LPS O-acetylase OafA/YrhL